MTERLRLVDFVDDEFVIDGETFEDVTLVGPAVLAPLDDVTIQDSEIGMPTRSPDFVDAVLWEVRDGSVLVGVIGVTNTTFSRVRFEYVAFVGTADMIAEMKRDLFGEGPPG